jgi:hypothetical protein
LDRILLTRHHRADDGEPWRAGDVSQHGRPLHVHLAQSLLQVLHMGRTIVSA